MIDSWPLDGARASAYVLPALVQGEQWRWQNGKLHISEPPTNPSPHQGRMLFPIRIHHPTLKSQ